MSELNTDEPLESAARTPPYVSYRTFLTLLDELKTNGLPPQIDRSVLRRFSGGVASQLIMALKSLGLTTAKSEPTSDLSVMVRTYGTPEFKPHLAAVLRRSYRPILGTLNLTTATPSMFAEAFRSNTGAKEDVLRKCRTFFLHAAQDAGVELSPRLLSGSAPRGPRPSSNGRQRKTSRSAAGRQGEAQGGAATSMPTMQTPPPKLEYQLVDLLKRPDMTGEVQDAIWQVVRYLSSSPAAQDSDNGTA